MESKFKCKECSWHGMDSELLHAPNPFDIDELVVGCPHCKSVDSMVLVCDEPGCWLEVSCGTPTQKGYRSTCGEHQPNQSSGQDNAREDPEIEAGINFIMDTDFGGD